MNNTQSTQIYMRYFQHWGLGFIAISVLYLVAANWWMLEQKIQLVIPSFFAIFAAIIYSYSQEKLLQQSLLTIIGLMLGLSLAVIGQVYQTGADSYLLFLGWSILLLPWIYGFYPNNDAVLVLFIGTTQLALYLFFAQHYYLDIYPEYYSLALNLLSFFLLWIIHQYYPKLIVLASLALGVLCITQMLLFVTSHYAWHFFVSAFLLPFSAVFYFYRKKHILSLSLLGVSIGLAFILLFFNLFITYLNSVFLIALFFIVLCLVLFGTIGYLILNLNTSLKFAQIPLALGAWLSGWALLVLILSLVSFSQSLIAILGIVVWSGALFYLHQVTDIFKRQCCYSLIVFGQISIYWGLFLYFDGFNLASVILQLCIMMVFFRMNLHWFVLLLQLIAGYILTTLFLMESPDYLNKIYFLNYLIIIVSIGLIQKIHQEKQLSILFFLLWMMLVQVFFSTWLDEIMPYQWFIILSMICMFFIQQQFLKHLTKSMQLAIWAVSLILILWGYFEIVLILLIWAWSIEYQEKLLSYIAWLSMLLVLFYLYYDLNTSFLYKSASIFLSGCVFIAFSFLVKNHLKMEKQYEK